MCPIQKMMAQHPNVDLVIAEIGGCSAVGLSCPTADGNWLGNPIYPAVSVLFQKSEQKLFL